MEISIQVNKKQKLDLSRENVCSNTEFELMQRLWYYLGIAAAAAAAAFVAARLALVALGIVGSIEEYSICGQACIGLNAGVVAQTACLGLKILN